MKKIYCAKCQNELNHRRDVTLKITPRGYERLDAEIFATCPQCGNVQKVRPKELPLGTRWKIFKVTCF